MLLFLNVLKKTPLCNNTRFIYNDEQMICFNLCTEVCVSMRTTVYVQGVNEVMTTQPWSVHVRPPINYHLQN